MADKDVLGRAGEDRAARYFEERGYAILARNWRCREGELDLVVADARALVAVEVKTRRGEDFGHPFEAVRPAKLERLHRLGWEWCETHRMRGRLARIDLVAVLLPVHGEPTIEHLEDVR